MKISTIQMQKLQAGDGMVLTNGEAYSSVGGYVYLPENADTSGWFEIAKKQYEQIEASKQDSVN